MFSLHHHRIVPPTLRPGLLSSLMKTHLINLLNSNPSKINHLNQIHAHIITHLPSLTSLFFKKLLNTSFINYALKVFDTISQPDQTLHNSLISAFSKLSRHEQAITHFILMHKNCTRIDFYSVPPVLKSCSSLLALEIGLQVHCLVVNNGLGSSVFVQTALVDFYSKIGNVGAAKVVFDGISVKDPISFNCLISGFSKAGDVLMARKLFDQMGERTLASWNAMLSCYVHNGDFLEGFRIFEKMQEEKVRPNEFTAATVLSICAKIGNLELGLRAKQLMDDYKLCENMIVSTAVLEMYVKCGAVNEARREFDMMVERDVVAWSAMLAGYVQNGRSMEALELFESMEREQIEPNDITLVSILSACAQLGSVEAAERIGSYVESKIHGVYSNLHLASALLAMYSKCGNVEKARLVFANMPQRDVASWNSMIMGLAINGFAEESITLYEKMKEIGINPDEITFIGLLTACTHAGHVDLGFKFFKKIRSEHGMIPDIEHYACIVDLLCRSGRLKEAYEFVCQMEIVPNNVIWGTLLGACRTYLNVELAEIVVNKLLELEPDNSGNYILLSNIYSSLGKWQEASRVRSLMRSKSLQKISAYSWVELENKVHKFLVGDKSHPRTKDVYNAIHGLALHWNKLASDIEFEMEFS